MRRLSGVLLLAIDGAQKCGVAWDSGDGTQSTTCAITDLGGVLRGLQATYPNVEALIEKAKSRYRLFTEHRASANACIKAVRTIWARHNTIRTVDPKTWQSCILHLKRDENSKEKSIAHASKLLGKPIEDHNESDAVCQLEFLKDARRGGL